MTRSRPTCLVLSPEVGAFAPLTPFAGETVCLDLTMVNPVPGIHRRTQRLKRRLQDALEDNKLSLTGRHQEEGQQPPDCLRLSPCTQHEYSAILLPYNSMDGAFPSDEFNLS